MFSWKKACAKLLGFSLLFSCAPDNKAPAPASASQTPGVNWSPAETEIHWSDVLELSSSLSAEQRTMLETCLDQFQQTPEGRRLFYDIQPKEGKITISGNHIPLIGSNAAIPKNVNIDFHQLRNKGYIAENGTICALSLQHTLYHELTHKCTLGFGGPDFEKTVIKATNRFMTKYYGETPRVGHGVGNMEPELSTAFVYSALHSGEKLPVSEKTLFNTMLTLDMKAAIRQFNAIDTNNAVLIPRPPPERMPGKGF
jgi:hypothetical protein